MENSNQILKNIKKLSARNLGYMAAIIDGEGCVRIQNERILRISVGNTSTKLFKFLNNKIGGKTFRLKNGVGEVKGSFGMNKKPFYSWRVAGDSAHFLLLKISDDLIIKREAAKWALKFKETFNHGIRYRRGGLPKSVWDRRKLISNKVNSHNRGRNL